MVGRREDGTPDVRSVYAGTQKQCLKLLRELRARQDGGLLGDARAERGTVAALLAAWLGGKQGTVEATSWARYEQCVRLHLTPALGARRLSALRPEHLRGLYAAKLRGGLSPKSVRYLHLTIDQALDQAVRDGDLPRNVAAAVDAAQTGATRDAPAHPGGGGPPRRRGHRRPPGAARGRSPGTSVAGRGSCSG